MPQLRRSLKDLHSFATLLPTRVFAHPVVLGLGTPT